MKDNWGLLGHDWAVDMLRQHVVQHTERHAYLFCGPPGVGRRTLALRFAQALNCTEMKEPGTPCGTCRECRQIDAMQHPDLLVVRSEGEGDILKVDQVRAARRTLILKPYQSRWRVALFLRFQEANDSASNALLKMLEEAPEYAILILTAENSEQLLPTIVSRCEVLRLRPSPLEAVEAFLKEHGTDEAQARLLAHLSGGRPGYALRLMQDGAMLEFRREKIKELQSLLPAKRVDKFAYADKLSNDRDRMRSVILLWLSFWHDVLLRSSDSATRIANVDFSNEIEAIAGRVNLSEARQVVSDLETALEQLDANVNPRLLAEVLLLDWPKI